MPITSKKQYKLMQDVADGSRKIEGLSPAQARDMLNKVSTREAVNLPTESPNAKPKVREVKTRKVI